MEVKMILIFDTSIYCSGVQLSSCQKVVLFQICKWFAADEAGHRQSEVEITLGFKGVQKQISIPGQHVQELLDVYGLLQHLQLSGTVQCKSLQVREAHVQ